MTYEYEYMREPLDLDDVFFFFLSCIVVSCRQAEDDVIRSGILEITDKQSVVLLSAIAMAMDLQEDAAPTDQQSLAMEVCVIL